MKKKLVAVLLSSVMVMTLFAGCGSTEEKPAADADTDVYAEMTTDDFNLKGEDGSVKAISYCYEAFGLITNKALLKEAGYEVSDITDFAYNLYILDINKLVQIVRSELSINRRYAGSVQG